MHWFASLIRLKRPISVILKSLEVAQNKNFFSKNLIGQGNKKARRTIWYFSNTYPNSFDLRTPLKILFRALDVSTTKFS